MTREGWTKALVPIGADTVVVDVDKNGVFQPFTTIADLERNIRALQAERTVLMQQMMDRIGHPDLTAVEAGQIARKQKFEATPLERARVKLTDKYEKKRKNADDQAAKRKIMVALGLDEHTRVSQLSDGQKQDYKSLRNVIWKQHRKNKREFIASTEDIEKVKELTQAGKLNGGADE